MTVLTSRFELAAAFVLQHEGGFVQHSRDPGGATKFGITRETLFRARGRPASVDDVRRLTEREAVSIYRRLYWNLVRAEELPPGVDLAVFDLAVNSGVVRAAGMLQTVLGVEADGIVGPVTLEAAREADPASTIRRLTRVRLGFLSRLATWRVFGRGWRRRVLAVEQGALRLASSSPPSSRNV
ncbi:glycoside hydrolase family 108 protein [Microvirga sp. BT689]|uniref:glycoside hydrolase family 108 protein n=1 Tax=Microvirga arvi TaxID=2778731 RepID=UPI00194FC588|nr:glycoside hydrolase family 108 protein [Microvirga arvi]MBM6581392.1 glycoside hydrolase family 108 protein [Microvirga arvi]